jgi:hypothetical protein
VNGQLVKSLPAIYTNLATNQYVVIVALDSLNTVVYTDFGLQLTVQASFPCLFKISMPNTVLNSASLAGGTKPGPIPIPHRL